MDIERVKSCLRKVGEKFCEHPIIGSLVAIGAITVGCRILETAEGLWRYVLRPSKNLFKTYGFKGAWAIITGGSAGIGLAYAKQLAKDGFNILLIARNGARLREARELILKETGKQDIEVENLSFDFSRPYSQEHYGELEQAIKNKSIAILVNNVGADHLCGFDEMDNDDIAAMLNTNINALTYLTRMVIPEMLKRPTRSAIIGVSSSFTGASMINTSLYTATKSYMDALLRCLHYELKDKCIDVLNCLTGEVTTQNNQFKNIWHNDPNTAVKGQLSALGRDRETAGTLRHAIYAMFLKSSLSLSYKKWLGKAAREATLKALKKNPEAT